MAGAFSQSEPTIALSPSLYSNCRVGFCASCKFAVSVSLALLKAAPTAICWHISLSGTLHHDITSTHEHKSTRAQASAAKEVDRASDLETLWINGLHDSLMLPYKNRRVLAGWLFFGVFFEGHASFATSLPSDFKQCITVIP